MNCLIILLLLSCCGHSNGVCGMKEEHHHSCGCDDHEHSCGCRKNNDDSYRNDKRRDNDCAEEHCDRCNESRREDRREERHEERCEDCRRGDASDCDLYGQRITPWQNAQDYGRYNSYSNRNETCGCEDK